MIPERSNRTDTVLLTAGLLLIGYLLGDVLLLVFAAVLIAVGLDGAARAIAGRLPVSRGWALVGVAFGVAAIIVGSLTLTATRLIRQFRELSDMVVELAERLQAWLTEQGAMAVIERLEDDGSSFAGAAGDMAGAR